MKIRRTDRFKKDYRKLPKDIQERLDEKLRFLLRDPWHPSLRIHKVRGVEGLRAFGVTMQCRVPFEIEGEHYVFLAVGPHRIGDRAP
jgi:mRNA-degrading endonuclease RelE of RelBE toxin-antitoxin system